MLLCMFLLNYFILLLDEFVNVGSNGLRNIYRNENIAL